MNQRGIVEIKVVQKWASLLIVSACSAAWLPWEVRLGSRPLSRSSPRKFGLFRFLTVYIDLVQTIPLKKFQHFPDFMDPLAREIFRRVAPLRQIARRLRKSHLNSPKYLKSPHLPPVTPAYCVSVHPPSLAKHPHVRKMGKCRWKALIKMLPEISNLDKASWNRSASLIMKDG
jgi:hypothetical protein